MPDQMPTAGCGGMAGIEDAAFGRPHPVWLLTN